MARDSEPRFVDRAGRRQSVAPHDRILAPGAVADPYSYFGELREREPVHWNERYRSWVVTRYDDVATGLRDPRFSADRMTPVVRRKQTAGMDEDVAAAFRVLQDWMVFKDPPDHTRLRRIVQRAFAPAVVEALRARIGEIAAGLIDALPPAGEIDLVEAYAYPLPAIVIAELLGVPARDVDVFKTWSDDIVALVFGELESEGRFARAAHGMKELVSYFSVLIADARRERRDDLISALVWAEEEQDALTKAEVVATCALFLFGGHETTSALIGSSVLALLRNPGELAALRADPRTAAEELLRYEGLAKIVVRMVAEEHELRGHRLRAGERAFLVLASGNRDPAQFERPDELDLARTPNAHLGLGLGPHYCLGAALARLEAALALPLLFERLPGLRLAGEIEWQPVLTSRALKRLPVAVG